MAAVLVCSIAMTATAQESPRLGAMSGLVWRDTTRRPLSDARVILTSIKREATTDARGHFRIDGVPAGRYPVNVRAIGFAPVEDTVAIESNAIIERVYVLRSIVQLDTLSVTAARSPSSIAARALADRRSTGMGQLISEEMLRKQDGRSLAQVIQRHIAGVRVVASGTGTYFASSRQVGRGGRSRSNCYVTVYLDGGVLYDGSSRAALAPDFENYEAKDFSSIEYYTSSTTPPEFRRAFTGCGVLVLRSREG